MQIDSLKYFIDACRLQSMTGAAEVNRVTRPAISQAILKLEAELGISLLNHKKRGFELTQAGQRVAWSATQVFGAIDQLRLIAQSKSKVELTGTFRIGVARAISTYRFDETLFELKKKNPGLNFKLSLESSERILDLLERRALDAAVVLSDENRYGLESKVLKKGQFQLLKPSSLKKECTYAVTEKRPEIDSLRNLYFKKFKSELPISVEVPSWDTIWNWIQRGHCGGLIPDFFTNRKHIDRSSYLVELPKVYPYEIRIYFQKSQEQNLLTSVLISDLTKQFSL